MAPLRDQGEGHPILKARRILVVEDQFLIAMEMQDCLEKAGAKVIGPLWRLQPALSSAEQESIDAAVLDVDLHGEECWPIADVLTQRAIPFVFTTGFAANIVIPERFAGCPVLSKPYREQDVLALLEKILQGYRR